MTPAYDIELLRVALERTISAAGAVHAHTPPDWLCHRCAHIIGECISLMNALKPGNKEMPEEGEGGI